METWPNTPGSTPPTAKAPQRISELANNQQTLLKSHQDVLTSLAIVDAPFRGGIISGDRSGVIKVWHLVLPEGPP
jgi:phosphoinositide-3-kinase, regulatory subunit 4